MKRLHIPFVPDFGSPISLRRTVHHEWVEECATYEPTFAESQYLGTSISPKKITAVFVLIACALIAFMLRSAQLQLFEGRGFAMLAATQGQKSEIVPARRGIIFDTNGTALVHNVPRFILELNIAELPRNSGERDMAVAKISALSGLGEQELREKISVHRSYEPLSLIDSIPYPDALRVLVETEKIPGLSVSQKYARRYATDGVKSLSFILGYLGRVTDDDYRRGNGLYRLSDMLGKEGVEFWYETLLRGRDGQKETEVDALGTEKRVLSEESAVDGKSLTLTIDNDIQKKSEEILNAWLKRFNSSAGVVIISAPRTGAIRALVNIPAFDSNAFSGVVTNDAYSTLISDPLRLLFNRALQGEYPSGSTIKPLVAAAALQEKIITPKTVFLSTGGIRISKWFFPDWKPGGHGRTNLSKALAESVNTYFYLIGGGSDKVVGLGIEKLVDYFYRFGLGAKTGIDLPSEADGFIPNPSWKQKKRGEQWYIGDTYHVAIGQGDILVTPLQVNAYTAYFANRGVSYVPHLIANTGAKQTVEHSRKPIVLKTNIIEQKHVDAIREGMRAAVLEGSARRMSLLSVSSAGKTGTAQWSSTKKPHAWFTGWAPYDDPELVITVLIEEGEEGSKSAIGAAYDILNWYFKKTSRALDSSAE